MEPCDNETDSREFATLAASISQSGPSNENGTGHETEEELFDAEAYRDFSLFVILVPLIIPILFFLFIFLHSFF